MVVYKNNEHFDSNKSCAICKKDFNYNRTPNKLKCKKVIDVHSDTQYTTLQHTNKIITTTTTYKIYYEYVCDDCFYKAIKAKKIYKISLWICSITLVLVGALLMALNRLGPPIGGIGIFFLFVAVFGVCLWFVIPILQLIITLILRIFGYKMHPNQCEKQD